MQRIYIEASFKYLSRLRIEATRKGHANNKSQEPLEQRKRQIILCFTVLTSSNFPLPTKWSPNAQYKAASFGAHSIPRLSILLRRKKIRETLEHNNSKVKPSDAVCELTSRQDRYWHLVVPQSVPLQASQIPAFYLESELHLLVSSLSPGFQLEAPWKPILGTKERVSDTFLCRTQTILRLKVCERAAVQ